MGGPGGGGAVFSVKKGQGSTIRHQNMTDLINSGVEKLTRSNLKGALFVAIFEANFSFKSHIICLRGEKLLL